MSMLPFSLKSIIGQARTEGNVPADRLLPLQVIGGLSALIFAFNFCLEIFTLLSDELEQQILIIGLQLFLAAWAIAEAITLGRRQPTLPLLRLYLLLGFQFLLEAVRLSVALWGQPFGREGDFGIFLLDVGPLVILVPLYLFVFFAISRTLMVIHGREFDEAWAKLTEAAVAQSKQQEREKLLRDMHDGFGSQIATMRIMAEHGRISPDELPQHLEEISADLHLVVDTLANSCDLTLPSALADMRYRLRRRIAADATRLHWSIDLPSPLQFDSTAILHILRIIQEAVNNSLRHGRPNNIWVEVEGVKSDGTVRISVRDDGAGTIDGVRRGRGISNMETRARELGAHIRWINHAGGVEVELRLHQQDGVGRPSDPKPDLWIRGAGNAGA